MWRRNQIPLSRTLKVSPLKLSEKTFCHKTVFTHSVLLTIMMFTVREMELEAASHTETCDTSPPASVYFYLTSGSGCGLK